MNNPACQHGAGKRKTAVLRGPGSLEGLSFMYCPRTSDLANTKRAVHVETCDLPLTRLYQDSSVHPPKGDMGALHWASEFVQLIFLQDEWSVLNWMCYCVVPFEQRHLLQWMPAKTLNPIRILGTALFYCVLQVIFAWLAYWFFFQRMCPEWYWWVQCGCVHVCVFVCACPCMYSMLVDGFIHKPPLI